MILSGIHEYYEPEELVGKTAIAIVNLPPRKMMGIFLIAKLTLVYPCKPLENRLSRILYTWSLLDVFLTFVRPKDVIRLKTRLFILRHVLPCQRLQY